MLPAPDGRLPSALAFVNAWVIPGVLTEINWVQVFTTLKLLNLDLRHCTFFHQLGTWWQRGLFPPCRPHGALSGLNSHQFCQSVTWWHISDMHALIYWIETSNLPSARKTKQGLVLHFLLLLGTFWFSCLFNWVALIELNHFYFIVCCQQAYLARF